MQALTTDQYTNLIRTIKTGGHGFRANPRIAAVLTAEASYEDIVDALDTLEKEAMEENHSMFLRLTDIVDAFIQHMKEADSDGN